MKVEASHQKTRQWILIGTKQGVEEANFFCQAAWEKKIKIEFRLTLGSETESHYYNYFRYRLINVYGDSFLGKLSQVTKKFPAFIVSKIYYCRSQWPRGLRRKSLDARLLRLWVRIPPGAWMFVCCECCVLSGRGLCDGLIIRSEESYRLWGVVVCDQKTSQARRLKPTRGL